MNKSVTITITLDTATLDFLKEEAKRQKTTYQALIRNIIHEYIQKIKKNLR